MFLEPMVMEIKIAPMIQRHGFWLVLLCHCLLFSGLSFEWVSAAKLFKQEKEDSPSLFIPSYVAQDETAPALQQPAPSPPVKSQEAPPLEDAQKSEPTSKSGI